MYGSDQSLVRGSRCGSARRASTSTPTTASRWTCIARSSLGPFGLWIRPDELLARREPFLLGGRRLSRLDDTGMLLNVAMHASLGWWPPRLVPLRDVLQVTNAGGSNGVARTVGQSLASDGRLRPRVLAVGVDARGGGASTELTQLRRRCRRGSAGPSTGTRATGERREARRSRRYEAIPDVRSKATYVAAFAFPGKEFLEARTRPADGPRTCGVSHPHSMGQEQMVSVTTT